MIAAAVLIFIAGGASALVGERLLGGDPGDDELRVQTHGDWRVVCPPRSEAELNCTLQAEVVRDQVLLSLEDPTLGSRLRVVVPHGVFLDPGLGFTIGDQPLLVYQYETCMANGCFAHVTLDTATLDLMRNNMNGQIVVVPSTGTPVTIPFSLNGFSAGYESLIEEREQRNSLWGYLAR
jgi:invasion protein IalB